MTLSAGSAGPEIQEISCKFNELHSIAQPTPYSITGHP
jgi:hypothetical protein